MKKCLHPATWKTCHSQGERNKGSKDGNITAAWKNHSLFTIRVTLVPSVDTKGRKACQERKKVKMSQADRSSGLPWTSKSPLSAAAGGVLGTPWERKADCMSLSNGREVRTGREGMWVIFKSSLTLEKEKRTYILERTEIDGVTLSPPLRWRHFFFLKKKK